MLLVVACGVPISPQAITATAVADEHARAADQTSQTVSQADSASNPATLSQRAVSLSAVSDNQGGQPAPIATREPSTADAPDEDGTPEDESNAEDEAGDATPEAEATPTPVVSPATVSGTVQTDIGMAQQFLGLLNDLRRARGLAPLSFSTAMSAGATDYAADMATNRFFGHYGPEGSSPPSRMNASGYYGQFKGEALTAGQASAQSALNALLASGPHAAILLDATAVDVGVGYVQLPGSPYTYYWVIITAVP